MQISDHWRGESPTKPACREGPTHNRRRNQIRRQEIIQCHFIRIRLTCKTRIADRNGIGHRIPSIATWRTDRVRNRKRRLNHCNHWIPGGVHCGIRKCIRIRKDRLCCIRERRRHCILIAHHVIHNSPDPDDKGIIRRNIVGSDRYTSKGEMPVRAVLSKSAAIDCSQGGRSETARITEIRCKLSIAGRCAGDNLKTGSTIEREIQTHPGWNNIIDAKILSNAFGHRYQNIVNNALANHHIIKRIAACGWDTGVIRSQ